MINRLEVQRPIAADAAAIFEILTLPAAMSPSTPRAC